MNLKKFLPMKKTLLVTIDYPPRRGGVARYLERLVHYLPNDKVVVLQPYGWRLWPKWLPFFWQIYRQIKNNNIQILWAAQPLPVGTVVRLLSKFLKIPYIVNTHGLDVTRPLALGGRKEKLLKKVLTDASYVTVNSNFTKNIVNKLGVVENKIILIYPCPDQLVIQSSAISPSADKIILSVGRLIERKGFDLTLKALALIKQPYHYVIVGDGPYRQNLLQLTQQLGLVDKVTFAGQISDDELDNYYRQASIFVMPARQINDDVEGFGLVFLEAGRYGLPVIGGQSGGQADAIIDGQTGYLIDPNDPVALAEKIKLLLNDETLAQQIGQAGQVRVKQNFVWLEQAEKLEKILS